jgi:hypothetical protein
MQTPGVEGNFVTEADLEEYKDLIDNLMNEFEGEIAAINGRLSKAETRLDDVENRVGALERIRRSIEWSGLMRTRVESIITDTVTPPRGVSDWNGYYNGLYGQINERCQGRKGAITPIISGFDTTPGMGESDPELEMLIYMSMTAKPADYLDVFLSLEHISSYTDAVYGTMHPSALFIDEAWMNADMMKLLGWDQGDVLKRFNLLFGYIYGRMGEYGLAFDNGYRSRPGFFFDLGGDRLDLQFFLGQNEIGGVTEALAAFRAAYGFGDSRSERLERDYFAKLGVNVLASGVGDEDGYGIDLNTEPMTGSIPM